MLIDFKCRTEIMGPYIKLFHFFCLENVNHDLIQNDIISKIKLSKRHNLLLLLDWQSVNTGSSSLHMEPVADIKKKIQIHTLSSIPSHVQAWSCVRTA